MSYRSWTAAFATVIITAVATAAPGADLPPTKLSMAGMTSTQNMNRYILAPYFEQELADKTGGALDVDYKTADALGLHGTEVLRLLKLGVFDIATGAISYMAGEDPRFEGVDLPGLTLDIGTTRAAVDAYRPVLAERLAQNHDAHLFALSPIAVQVWYCNKEIGGLDDVAGKKVRVFNRSMADFVEAAGAASVNIPFAEVVPAMNRGVADCALTGTSAGNTARWWEVTHWLYNLPMGWAIQFYAINLDSWGRLSPDVQSFLTAEWAMLEDRMWAQAAADVQDGIDCNLGNAESCKDGIPADPAMVLVEVSESDRAKHREIMGDTVVARWAERCGAECTARWNETVGRVVGIEAPLP